ncbi:hypothetical protein G7046_g2838 [Stylonectria norvegica]|nr:hypothetical protein G7046_g2838 [Stylonectria norvegica]
MASLVRLLSASLFLLLCQSTTARPVDSSSSSSSLSVNIAPPPLRLLDPRDDDAYRLIPRISTDFPDPCLVQDTDGTWLSFATNGNGKHIQVASAKDPLGDWTLLDTDALPGSGWTSGRDFWAPDHCIGIATSATAKGPYTMGKLPLICPQDGGAIDAAGFHDTKTDRRYVVYKVESEGTPIMLQRVEDDGVTFIGDPTTILTKTAADGPLVEAPNLVLLPDGRYLLFFSSHMFDSKGYNVKYAFAPAVDGPYERGPGPLVGTPDYGLVGPGGMTSAVDGGVLVFHGWCEGMEKRCIAGGSAESRGSGLGIEGEDAAYLMGVDDAQFAVIVSCFPFPFPLPLPSFARVRCVSLKCLVHFPVGSSLLILTKPTTHALLLRVFFLCTFHTWPQTNKPEATMPCHFSSSSVWLVALLSLAAALQVTPNSPCSTFCLDSLDLDKSDPNSSNTRGGDIVCADDDFTAQPEGQKYQRCLSCLQDSTFAQGSENDQDWFLYNLRYSFDYCVFGYPNATGVGSNPCITSEACGPLEKALKDGIVHPADREQYGFCEADGKAMLSDAVESCHSCVKADRTHSYVSNFLIALEAGCKQQPVPGTTIGLNDTIFTETTVQIVDPSASVSATPSPGVHLATTAIVGIVIGVLVLGLLAAGCIFMHIRRRKNRTRRARVSSLSFRCQTHLTPRSPHFPSDVDDMREKAMSGLRTSPRLSNITTTIPCPPPIHCSPRLTSPDDYTTPTSTTSLRSNAPLLPQIKPYVPSKHAVAVASPLFSPGLALTTDALVPTTEGQWEEQHLAGAGAGRDLMMRRKGSWGAVAPVEAGRIQTSFAPPPRRK